MKRDNFRLWLERYGKNGTSPMSKRPIGDTLSRCARIEKSLNINLDSEFIKDGGRAILACLEYTADDVRSRRPAPVGIVFERGANIRNGMASLRSAARKYFGFCEYKK